MVAASGLTFLGIGAAFWALVAGLLVRAVLPRAGRPGQPVPPPPASQPASGSVSVPD